MSGRELSLQSALAKIESSSATQRKEGLADLKHIFNYNKSNHVISDFKDKTWHSIYEALFSCAAIERSSYLRSSQSQKSRAIPRLEACGKALRTTLEAGVKHARAKTVKAIVDHILQSLPTAEGTYCPGLAQDYVKSLRIILEYQPHVEHFRDLWQYVLDFCLEGLAPFKADDDDGDEVDSGNEPSATAGASLRTPSISLTRRSRAVTPQARRSRRAPTFRPEGDDLIACVHQLVRATNAPIATNELNIVDTMQTFLKLSDSVRLSYNEAFATINAVLARTTISSLELTHKIINNLIPLVKDLWSWKSTSLKEEMLITLVLTKGHVTSLASDTAQATFRIDLENLVDALQTDYSKRLERDQLHMGDLVLDFSSTAHGKSILKTPMFAMQRGRMRAEPLWAMLYLTASYVAALDQKKLALQGPSTKHGEDAPSKRSRMTTLLYHDILRLAASSPTPATRIANLQFLCFMFQLREFTSNAIEDLLETLITCMSDQNTNIARWAILALASFAAQQSFKREDLKDKWLIIVQQVSRLLTVEQCSRPAAYLFHVFLGLRVLSYGDVANTVANIFDSLELQGPKSVSDASLGLLGWLMEARAAENPSTATASAEQLIQWLFQRWAPSSFEDKETAARLSSTSRPYDYVQFLSTLRGQPVLRTTSLPQLCGPIAQAWLKLDNAAEVIDFLLLRAKAPDTISPETSQLSSFTNLSALSINVHIIDALEAETNRTLETWERIATDRPQSILPDMIKTVLGLVIVNAVTTSQPDERITRRIESLRKKSDSLVKSVMNVLARADFEAERLDVAFDALADYIPLLSQQIETENFPDDIATICVHVTNMLERRQQGKQATASTQEDIDMDDGFESQASEAAMTAQPDDIHRDLITLSTNRESFRRQITVQAHLITALLKVSVEHGHVEHKTFSASIVTYLTELPPAEFFACRSIFLDILIDCNVLQVEALEELFDHLSYFLSAYDYNRHEVALLLEVDLLHHAIADWTSQDYVAVHEMGTEAYEWFIGTALKADVVSSAVKLALVDLFFEMIKKHGPEYIAFPGAESTRTTLFKLLHSSDVTVLHGIIRQLPDIFHQYTLDTHENVFDDIHTNSLYSEEWLEGNALRMLLFSTLGSRWHTLVRRCLYHVFETAGTILQTSSYATRCIAQVAESVQLPDSQSLFRLFAGQLLYTWTRSTEGHWNNVPFGIFGYRSLKSLLVDVREEVYAQLLMRNDPDELVDTAAKLGNGQSELATISFARSLAYSLNADAEQKSERPTEKDRSETRLRAVVGSHYSSACRAHFPKALGILLLRTNFELKQTKREQTKTQQSGSNGTNSEESGKEVFERTVEKRISNEKATKRPTMFEDEALHAFKAMRLISASDMKLPDPQQPMFRPKVFFDVADRLARRSKITLPALFEPAVYVFVLRLLLSSLHDSLGSLHACLIVRKIRILVALSGQSVLSGYPLEITLHSLRPLLTDKQCAEDALGIVQYLYTHGIDYLKQELRFVAGMNITTLISLRKFAGSPQESTTQESQHRTTINKANTFRTWLVDAWNKKFLENMEDTSTLQAYMKLVSWAYTANGKANALPNTKESSLILQILDDRRSKRGLLPSATWNLALELFCHDFEEPLSYRDDVLGLDHQAKTYASDIWASCKNKTGNTRYFQWAAKVLGRASNSPDFDSTTLLSDQKPIEWDVVDADGNEISTKTIILTVSSFLLSGDRAQTGLAEETLRAILLRTAGYPETQVQIQEYLQAQSSSVIEGLALMTEDVVVPLPPMDPLSLESCFDTEHVPNYDQWLRQLAITLIALNAGSPIVGSLSRILVGVPGCAESLFAPILHLVLEQDVDSTSSTRQILSQAFQKWFTEPPAGTAAHIRVMLQAIIYLRRQPHPRETTHADRLKWLEIDFNVAAKAAHRSGMHTAALMFAELSTSMLSAKSSRKSTLSATPTVDEDTMLDIFRNIQDPDSFYGVPQPPSLDLVLSRLDHESDGFKGLMFRGARLDSQMRMKHELSTDDNAGLVRSLIGINMNAIAYNLISGRQGNSHGADMVDSTMKTAMNLEQWDIRVPDTAISDTATLYRIFQAVNNATNVATIRKELDAGLLQTFKSTLNPSVIERTLKSKLRTLGVLAEIDDMVTSRSAAHLNDAWDNIRDRSHGLISASPSDVRSILSSREILMSTLSANSTLRDVMCISLSDARKLQANALLSSSRIWRRRHNSQQSLAAVTCLSDLVPICATIGVDITKGAQNAVSDVLWAQGEYSTSIRMLQVLVDSPRQKDAVDDVQQSSLLAKLGHHIAVARLEPPDQIMSHYLGPAIQQLKSTKGDVAGQVYHQFATFCYDQLQSQDSNDDLARATKLRNRRQAEYDAMVAEVKGIKSQSERKTRESDLRKARKWLELDNIELNRLIKIRGKLIEQCLENFMLALSASDEHDNDALRFFAVWLENAESDLANAAVSRHIDKIASHKFVRLMNQLSSRMQADNSLFQKLLLNLVLRICKEHPFHGMHHITAGVHTPGTNQVASRLRHQAAKQVASQLKTDKVLGNLWYCVYQSDRLYHDVCRFTDDDLRAGRESRLDKFQPTKHLHDNIDRLQTPPPTLSIPIRADLDYAKVPRVIGFHPTMRIAGGLSAPKIITSKLSDGSRFKQLFKGGNDDLRQDAIMEQVFEEVSKLLGNHTATRQRKLRIRTYNVLPLSNATGVIEFAPNTTALQDVLIPLHQDYHPKDLKSSACRSKIAEASRNTTEDRIRVFKNVCAQFQPAMRHFFFENFTDPDVWFESRLAYTRSTAAISILGHVIGLGDRHLHNILLDYVTGEVVHIDLGVCFEGGRVLPIPELVPFRLTRDLVDGMGYTRTEGVFRRCCEFTLETLREELESIMTLLNVLRYDPLYSWTVSAAKAKRIQDADDGADRGMNDANLMGEFSSKKKDDDMGEAGRALSVVEKKLGETLSKEATVSELIAQATDERNLALLFAGWSAWV